MLLLGGNKSGQQEDINKAKEFWEDTMPKRSQHWEEGLSESLITDPSERKEYFLALVQEGFSWREALRITIESIGVKEYAEMAGVKAPNLISQLSKDKDIRISTLEKMVKPLNLGLSFSDIEKTA